ncbi:uncharacterized protein LOC132726330, partial [Ruditapes philippinarum]|uniref:uncharacterized protein LOC132726330 n=1 Tax=Ruditapes philippinarum TaxID=129788 RepID=UPI00295B1843
PSGGSARHTHNRFAVAASNPCGAKSTKSYHTVKSNLESDGNRRPTRAPAARQIGGISKVERKDEERRTNRSNGTYREPNDEILKITKQIKKLFNNIRDGTKDKNVKEEVFRNEPDSSEDMLKCIEWYFRQYQQEIERYQQGKKNVEAEIVKLAKDVIDADAGIEKEIHEQIISIRLQMEQQKRTYLERLEELELKSQYNRQVFGDLCTLLKIDLEPRQKGGSNDNWKVIVEDIKRLVEDKDHFVEYAEKWLKDISTLITREPFSEHFDTKLALVQEPDFQQLLSGMHNVQLCLEDYLKSHKEKFVKIEAWNELRECRKRLQKEIGELKEEKDVLLNRLSKMAGANLTDNNPAIADLSDPNRATKLAEQFSELYDNSWTDAYEVLEISDEKECIQYLLNIIVVSQDSGLNLSKLQSRTLSDLRKTSADLSIVDVKSYIAAKNENWLEKVNLKQFTLSCIELCWFMHLQSPPVYLDATLVSGSTFDTNKYKPYTKSGKGN